VNKDELAKKRIKEETDDNEFLREQQQQKRQNNMGGGGPGRRGPGNMLREKPKNMGKTLRRLFRYIGKSKYLVIGLLVMTVLITVMNLCAPALQGSAIDAIYYKGEDGVYYFNSAKLIKSLVGLAIVYVIASSLTFFVNYYAAKLSQQTVYMIRNNLFEKIAYLPIKYTDTHKHGDIMSRLTNDADNVSMAISSSISSLFSGVIMLIGSMVMMLYYSWQLTIVALVTIPVTIFLSTFLAKFMRKYFVKQQRILGSLNSNVEESVTGFKTLAAYNKQDDIVDKFTKDAAELKRTAIKAQLLGGIMGPMMNLINNIGFLLIAVVGGSFAIKGIITIGVIQSFIQYSRQFTRPINELANQYASILTAIAGAERIFEIIDAQSEKDIKGEAMSSDDIKGNISFSHVKFSYKQDEPVLKDFNLEVKSGQKIAIVGKTGAGKTTIVNLLTRFYDIDDGTIKLDGVDIKDVLPSSLRSSIAIVLQDTVLFSDTIAENIRYGKLDATDDEVREAAAVSNADVFIERLENGYNTELSESGSNLSQGQKQLISIARAVLANPKILILDEATSSVDTRTEMHIQQAMLALMENRTSLIIAHRLSTIRDADMIIVLADGRIVESGNHEELLEQKGVYYDLYQTQFSGMAT